MGPFFFIVFLIVIIGIAVSAYNKSVNEAWSASASKLRLDYKGGMGGRQLSGGRTDMALEIKTESVGKSTWTVFSSEFAEPLPFRIRLLPQTFFSDLGSALLNRVDIETGHGGFDSKIIVDSTDPEQVRDFLDEQARAAILKLNARFDTFELTENGVTGKMKRTITNKDDLIELTRTLEKGTRKIWESAVEDADNTPIPPPLPSQRAKAEIEPEPDTEKEAEKIEDSSEEVERSVVPLPEPGVIEGAHAERIGSEEASSAPDESEEASTPDAPPFEVAEETVESDLARRCREVLSECQGRYAMQKQFDEKLKGEEVVATLPLLGAGTFSMDKHFGRGPGILRTFSLGKLSGGEKLKLVADTGEDRTLATVRSQIDETDTVLGTLIAFDPFSHIVFLRSSVSDEESDD